MQSGVDGGDGKCGERESGLLVSAIRSLEILSVKKEPCAETISKRHDRRDRR